MLFSDRTQHESILIEWCHVVTGRFLTLFLPDTTPPKTAYGDPSLCSGWQSEVQNDRRDILILSFWAQRRICKECYNCSVLSALSSFHVVSGPGYGIFCPDATRKYAYWMILCRDRAFFDTFSTGHDTSKKMRMEILHFVQDDSMRFKMTEWGSEWQ